MKTILNRRDFIVDISKRLGLTVFSPTIINAFCSNFAFGDEKNQEPHFLLVMRASGGAHPPIGLDPLIVETLRKRKIDPVGENDFYAAYRDDELVKAKDILLGPAGSPLVSIIDDIAIINGILMLPNTPLHESNLEFMSSGSTRSAPFFPFQLAEELGGGPIGVIYKFGLGDQGVGTPVDSLKSTDSNDFLKVLKYRANNMGSEVTSPILQIQSLSSNLQTQFDLFKSIFENNRYSSSGSEDVPVIAAAMASGLVKYGILDLDTSRGTLDSHSNHAAGHRNTLFSVFQQFADTISFFKRIKYQGKESEKSLFDYTTFVFLSDFARTAVKEGEDGTGHNPHDNSCIVAGKGVRGGQVIGASTIFAKSFGESRLQALPYDFDAKRVLTIEDMAEGQRNNISYSKFCSVGYEPNKTNCVSFITPGTVFKTISQAFGMKNGTKYLENNGVLTKLLKA